MLWTEWASGSVPGILAEGFQVVGTWKVNNPYRAQSVVDLVHATVYDFLLLSRSLREKWMGGLCVLLEQAALVFKLCSEYLSLTSLRVLRNERSNLILLSANMTWSSAPALCQGLLSTERWTSTANKTVMRLHTLGILLISVPYYAVSFNVMLLIYFEIDFLTEGWYFYSLSFS